MTYTPVNWQTGDIITAEKLNKMDKGWSVETSSEQLFSETVTTVDDGDFNYGVLTYSETVPDGILSVTFDGTDYTCTCSGGGFGSTNETFEDYPFYVFYSERANSNAIETATEGTHTIAVSTDTSSVELSSDFQTAITSAASDMKPLLCVSGTTTYNEMIAAMTAGRVLFFKPYNDNTALCYITGISSEVIGFVPEIQDMSAAFDNGVFTVNAIL